MEGDHIEMGGFLKVPSNTIIAAPTGSGKTSLCIELIRHRNYIFESKFEKIILCYSIMQDSYKMLQGENVEFFQGVPDVGNLEEWSLKDGGKHVLCIFDDLANVMLTKSNIAFTEALFEKYGHHFLISNLFITQNIFNKSMRHISLNSHYFIILKYVRDLNQVNYLARQIFPDQSKSFMNAYNDAIQSSSNYDVIPPYVLVKCHPFDSTYQIFTNILPFQNPPILYILT